MSMSKSVFLGLLLALTTHLAMGDGARSLFEPSGLRAVSAALKTHSDAGRTNNAWEMPVFRLRGVDGRLHQLDEWRGKVILLNFWASWCAPCQYEIKEFIKYQQAYGPRGLQIIGMGVDKARSLRNAGRTLGINYPVLFANGKLMRQWGNRTGVVPYNVIIDRDGRIAFIHRGPMDRAAFERKVVRLLGAGRI